MLDMSDIQSQRINIVRSCSLVGNGKETITKITCSDIRLVIFSKPREGVFAKRVPANFGRGLGCPQQAERVRFTHEAGLRISEKDILSHCLQDLSRNWYNSGYTEKNLTRIFVGSLVSSGFYTPKFTIISSRYSL